MGPTAARVIFRNPQLETPASTRIMTACMIRPSRLAGGKCPTLVLFIKTAYAATEVR